LADALGAAPDSVMQGDLSDWPGNLDSTVAALD
jgi:hypothetical protein